MTTTPIQMLHFRPSCSPTKAVKREPKKAPTKKVRMRMIHGIPTNTLPSRIATIRPRMVAPGLLKVLLKAVPLTEHHWLVVFQGERAVETSTEASHQAIVEADLEKAQSCHTNHASKQRIAAKLNHVGRSVNGRREKLR
jgi:hypothetical protein